MLGQGGRGECLALRDSSGQACKEDDVLWRNNTHSKCINFFDIDTGKVSQQSINQLSVVGKLDEETLLIRDHIWSGITRMDIPIKTCHFFFFC